MIWAAAFSTSVAMWLALRTVTRSPRGSARPSSRRPTQRLWLGGSDLDVTPFQFWSASLGVAALTFVFVFAVTSLSLVAMMPALVVATFPRAYFARRKAQRLAEVQNAWPDGIRDLISSVRSGASLPAAMENLALFGPGPLRDAFAGFSMYARSLGFVSALEMFKADLRDPTSDRVIEVLILGYEKGGSVVPQILSDLAEATTRDVWALEEIRTEALEQKINARVVFVLPWLVLIAMTARSGAFREFYSTRAGLVVVIIGGLMSVAGMVISSKLGSQPVEPRVFDSVRRAPSA